MGKSLVLQLCPSSVSLFKSLIGSTVPGQSLALGVRTIRADSAVCQKLQDAHLSGPLENMRMQTVLMGDPYLQVLSV